MRLRKQLSRHAELVPVICLPLCYRVIAIQKTMENTHLEMSENLPSPYSLFFLVLPA
jgi:hypothetical protein